MLRCSLLLALVRWGVGDIAWSQINFYPDNTEKCKETEITVIFDVEGGFAVGDQITFYLGGMTRGNCENANGAAISDGLVLLGSPSGLEEWSGEYGGYGVGKVGNKCHVDCSNRGFCDTETGQCKCFAGFYGPACDTINVKALGEEL